MTKTELITARDIKNKNSCDVPCLFCGSSSKYVCTFINADRNYIEVDCSCSACNKKWVEMLDAEGSLKDIWVPGKGTYWSPSDLK